MAGESGSQLLDATNLGKYRFEVVDVGCQSSDLLAGVCEHLSASGKPQAKAADGIVRTIPEAI